MQIINICYILWGIHTLQSLYELLLVDVEILPEVEEFWRNELKNDVEEDWVVELDGVNTDDVEVEVLEKDEEEEFVVQLLLKL